MTVLESDAFFPPRHKRSHSLWAEVWYIVVGIGALICTFYLSDLWWNNAEHAECPIEKRNDTDICGRNRWFLRFDTVFAGVQDIVTMAGYVYSYFKLHKIISRRIEFFQAYYKVTAWIPVFHTRQFWIILLFRFACTSLVFAWDFQLQHPTNIKVLSLLYIIFWNISAAGYFAMASRFLNAIHEPIRNQCKTLRKDTTTVSKHHIEVFASFSITMESLCHKAGIVLAWPIASTLLQLGSWTITLLLLIFGDLNLATSLAPTLLASVSFIVLNLYIFLSASGITTDYRNCGELLERRYGFHLFGCVKTIDGQLPRVSPPLTTEEIEQRDSPNFISVLKTWSSTGFKIKDIVITSKLFVEFFALSAGVLLGLVTRVVLS